jgi:orotidine-5'-phosphate decarboxylase
LHKYNARVDAVNSLLCVGLDSELKQLPERFQGGKHPQFAFNKWIIEQTAEFAAAFKPNMAFYEARGAEGLIELAMTIEYLRAEHPNVFTICDAKRADIGNTNRGYVELVFDRMGFDSITLHPYLGGEALQPFLEREDKMCIVLCRTSNVGAREFQDLACDGSPLWQAVAERVNTDWNVRNNCALVVGATYPKEMRAVREIAPRIPLLVPGVGAQGGDAGTVVAAGMDAEGRGLMINSSRGILFSDDPAVAARILRDEINAARSLNAGGSLNAAGESLHASR